MGRLIGPAPGVPGTKPRGGAQRRRPHKNPGPGPGPAWLGARFSLQELCPGIAQRSCRRPASCPRTAPRPKQGLATAPGSGRIENPGRATQLRKTLKPLMEKRRRARINDSLNQLKTLILPLIGKHNSRYSKLEKADILEMTVQFLKEIPAPSPQAPDPAKSYQEGYRACLSHLTGLLAKCHLLDRDSGNRLLEHLQRMGSEPIGCQDCSAPKDLCPASWRAVPPRPARRLLEASPLAGQAASPGIWRPW